MHWNYAVFRNWFLQGRQRPFKSSPTYPIPLLPEAIPVEAALKIIVPLIGILTNLIGTDGWRCAVTCA